MKRLFAFFLLNLVSFSALAIPPGHSLDRPIIMGPQFPLLYTSTTYEPDLAFTLKEGESFIETSSVRLNSFAMSANNEFQYNYLNYQTVGSKNAFLPTTSTGYSSYFDGEFDRRAFRWYYGWSNDLEIQFVYRELKVSGGTLDSTAENFHSMFNLFNQYRDITDQNLLDIYIYDNETGQLVYQITAPTNGYIQESMSLGLKFLLRETSTEAISFTIKSNFQDYQFERGLNEIADSRSHRNFNDSNMSLNYSSYFQNASLHAGISVTSTGNSLLARSPNELYYLFLGINHHYSQNLDWIFQVLQYSSPFPEDNISHASDDVKEVTLGMKWLMFDKLALETGFVENQDHGPSNIDIAFFANLNTSF